MICTLSAIQMERTWPHRKKQHVTIPNDDRMQVDSLKKGKRKGKGKQPTRALQTSTRARTVANLDTGRKTAGLPVEERDSSTYRNTGKGKSKHTGKGTGKHVNVVETEQPQPSETASTVSFPSQDPSVVGELSCTPSVDPWIMGVTVNSVSSRCRVCAS